jgi:hypothetical protein
MSCLKKTVLENLVGSFIAVLSDTLGDGVRVDICRFMAARDIPGGKSSSSFSGCVGRN